MAFNRALIFFNPAGTHAASGRQRIKELERLLGQDNVEVIETSPEGREANRELLRKHAYKLDEGTILGIAAGDGTTNQIIEALLMQPDIPEHARQTAILPLWGGNANDLAHMLNGPAYRANLEKIIKHGNVVSIHAVQCELVKNKKVRTYLAASYVSFGATAHVARRLNKSAHRQSRLHALPGGRVLQELITVLSGLYEAPTFSVKESDKVKVVYELSIYNGSRMAKIERLPATLTDELFYLNTFENKKLLSIIPRFVNFARKRVSQKMLRSYASFTTQENSWAQFDGEEVEVPAGTHVQVQLSTRPFYAISTTLAANNKGAGNP